MFSSAGKKTPPRSSLMVCCCQIAANGAAGGLRRRWYNNAARGSAAPAAPPRQSPALPPPLIKHLSIQGFAKQTLNCAFWFRHFLSVFGANDSKLCYFLLNTKAGGRMRQPGGKIPPRLKSGKAFSYDCSSISLRVPSSPPFLSAIHSLCGKTPAAFLPPRSLNK